VSIKLFDMFADLQTSAAEKGQDPNVIPMHFLGMQDMDMSKVSASELMNWGLVNLWEQEEEGGYAVCHGNQPVSMFRRPRKESKNQEPDLNGNYWERAFPVLFPYGEGGFEGRQKIEVSLREHIRWALLP
jgi:hypothetical protein